MIGTTISHYKIISKLGEGGMGEVYLAEDTSLDRNVALKFLPAQSTENEQAVERFKREAKAAAKLNHPNIVTIHEVGEHEGQYYIAMEHVDGSSLREVIQEGQLPINRVTDIATQICQGLQEAHVAGITHRDIKPENILLDTSDRVKILDFGLAQIKGASKLTKEASTLGTLKYMSPEQYQRAVADFRSDIWSFGVMVFEMLTSQFPFQGEYEAALMYSIVNEEPKSLSSLRQDIPQNLQEIVSKALEKDPENRWQSVEEILSELKKTESVAMKEPEKEKSIVVLPFDDMSPDKDNEYFSDGLTEEIIADLSHIHDLLVISRSSAMTFKGTKKKIKEIAKEVNVRYVLEGSVRKAGNNLRITAQLIDAKTDAHLWAEKYSGTLDDVFDIQEKVSRSIVDALKVKLTPNESKIIAEHSIDNGQAFELHLRAQYEIWLVTEESIERALQNIKSGLEIIGDNEILYADMGTAYVMLLDAGIKDDESYLIKAEDCANKVFTLNPESSYGHQLRGLIYKNRGDVKKCIDEIKEALKVNPNNTSSQFFLGWIYSISGKGNVARSLFNTVLKTDPLTPINHLMLGSLEYLEGNFSDALEPLNRFYQMDHKNPLCQYWYAKGLAYSNSYEKAYELIDLIEKDSPQTVWWVLGVSFKYALQQKKEETLKSVLDDFRSILQKDEIFPLGIAESYALINENEEAVNWLEHAVNRGFINYPFLNEYDPFLENIRGEERFKKLMERVKSEWENFEV